MSTIPAKGNPLRRINRFLGIDRWLGINRLLGIDRLLVIWEQDTLGTAGTVGDNTRMMKFG